jgi:arylsulfatase A-like enzyme/Tfp pilus assembly protein PilF
VTRSRRLALGSALLTLASLVAPHSACRRGGADKGARPSVVLVTLDTLRADRVGAWGGPHGLTPALDALAARGLVFDEAVSSVPLTLPSHATILTGLEPPRHGVRDNGSYVLPADVETLATRLKAAGYATGAFVGAYVLDRRFGLARGFDTYDDRITRNETGASILESQRRGGEVVDAALAWLGTRPGPVFLWTHLYDAHAPYDPPPPFREAHRDQPYDGEVAYVDACVGRLLEAVRARGAAQGGEPLVAVVADHGESLGEHGEKTHGFFVYQSTLRVPFLLAGPGVPAGERRGGLARTTDLMPTLLSAVGLPVPAGLDGVDRLKQPGTREAYAETLSPATFGWAALHSFRMQSLKLIDAPRPELYDLASDPHETKDLASERPDAVERLRQALRALRARARPAAVATPDAATQERLRALGYAAAPPVEDAIEASGRPDPKDRIELYRAFEEALWAGARGDRQAAIVSLQGLVSREPNNRFFRRSLAGLLRQSGRNAEAVAILGSAGQDRRDAEAWHERALALAEAGRAKEAEASEWTALSLNPGLAEPHNQLGILAARRGRPDEALAQFAEATTLDPNDAKAWNNRANALRALNRTDEAKAAYERAAELAPSDSDPLNGLGALAVQAGRPDEAIDLFRRALELSGGLAEARLNLAVALVEAGRRDEALRELDAVIQSAKGTDVGAKARLLKSQLTNPDVHPSR